VSPGLTCLHLLALVAFHRMAVPCLGVSGIAELDKHGSPLQTIVEHAVRRSGYQRDAALRSCVPQRPAFCAAISRSKISSEGSRSLAIDDGSLSGFSFSA